MCAQLFRLLNLNKKRQDKTAKTHYRKLYTDLTNRRFISQEELLPPSHPGPKPNPPPPRLKRVNGLFFKDPSMVYSEHKRNNRPKSRPRRARARQHDKGRHPAVMSINGWTAQRLDMIHTYWLKKLRAVHGCLAAQIKGDANSSYSCGLANTWQNNPDHGRGLLQGSDSFYRENIGGLT